MHGPEHKYVELKGEERKHGDGIQVRRLGSQPQ